MVSKRGDPGLVLRKGDDAIVLRGPDLREWAALLSIAIAHANGGSDLLRDDQGSAGVIPRPSGPHERARCTRSRGRTHRSRTLREMIARPKMSRVDWDTTEMRGFL